MVLQLSFSFSLQSGDFCQIKQSFSSRTGKDFREKYLFTSIFLKFLKRIIDYYLPIWKVREGCTSDKRIIQHISEEWTIRGSDIRGICFRANNNRGTRSDLIQQELSTSRYGNRTLWLSFSIANVVYA